MALNSPLAKSAAEMSLSDSGLPPDAYRLLARANLLRMRGRWDEAVEQCMAAMRLAPDNATAQSLLGDIYENQGRLDEAIQWYRMALDVQPDSPADRLKLSHLLAAKQLTAHPEARAGANSALAPENRIAPTERWLRVGAVLAAALTLGTISLSLWSVTHLARANASQINLPPIVLAPPVMESQAHSAEKESVPLSLHDPSEQALLENLRAAPELIQAGIVPTEAQVDPRAGRATITLACRPPAAPADQRSLILQAAQAALRHAVQATDARTITQFTLRCFLADDTNSTTTKPLAFVADGSREGLSPQTIWWSAAIPERS